MKNTKQMLYPSVTICESTTSARIFADGRFFESLHSYYNGTITSNKHDLNDVFISLGTIMPNMSRFTLKPSDINDRVAQEVFSK